MKNMRISLQRGFVASLVLAGFVLLMMACGVDTRMATMTVAASTRKAVPAGKSSSTMPPELRTAFIETRQKEASEAYTVVRNDAGTLRMPNPVHRFATTLEAEGIVVTPEGKPWTLSLRTVGVGCDGAETAVGASEPRAEGNRGAYERGELEEWYLNGPMGVEQGFTLQNAPQCTGTKSIRMQVTGGLSATLDDADSDGRGTLVRFVDEEGHSELRYADLIVKDATGKTLSAWMTVGDGEIALQWEDQGAVYPVAVDPAIVTEEAKLLSGDTGTEWDQFGTSVAISEDGLTAIVGALADSDMGEGAGAAYIFAYDGASWLQTFKLTASDGAKNEIFGSSVALSGTTALVGAPYDDDKGYVSGSAYVFVYTGVTWIQQAKLVASDGAPYDVFGTSVAISGDTAIVGAMGDDGSGSAYVFLRSGMTWNPQMKLKPADGAPGDQFGCSVALSATTAVVGARFDDDKGFRSGSVYVFVRTPANWVEQAKLTADDGAEDGYFGFSVALAGDTALVGAPGNAIGANVFQGSAYVFMRDGMTWTQQAKLLANDGKSFMEFGNSVALSGNSALVGASEVNNQGPGSAYVFVRSGATWSQQAKLVASDGTSNDAFGGSVAIWSDRVLIGAPLATGLGSMYPFMRNTGTWAQQLKFYSNDGAKDANFGSAIALSNDTALIAAPADDERGVRAGAVYVFTRNGTKWTKQAKLMASDAASVDWFGTSVALSGEVAWVGAPGDDGKGAVYVFVRNGVTWTEQAKVTASGGAGAEFGFAVALADDTVIVGAPWDHDNGTSAGAAYIFTRNNGMWVQQQKLVALDGAVGDAFGASVALSGDTVLVGAPSHDDVSLNSADCGAAYVFIRGENAWTQQAKLLASDREPEDYFGSSVALAGDTALVGAPYDNDQGDESGSAYVFQRSGTDWTQQVKLVSSNGSEGEYFGASVALTENTALVGAPFGNPSNFTYVFVRKGSTWPELTKFTASDNPTGAYLGHALALSPDGSLALVGAPNDDDEGSQSGAAYLFSLRRDLGLPCSGAAACASGLCVDGVCCDNPCEGSCRACSNALKGGNELDGYCGYAAAGSQDPGCAPDTAKPCGRTGVCNEYGTCAIHDYDDPCGQGPICIGSLLYTRQICNGIGSCIPDPNAFDTCGAYACENGACKEACTEKGEGETSDCAAGFICSAKQCVADSVKCESVEDCAPGLVCDVPSGTCVQPISTADTIEGVCGCRLPGSNSQPSALPLAFVVAIMRAARRRLRRAGTRSPRYVSPPQARIV